MSTELFREQSDPDGLLLVHPEAKTSCDQDFFGISSSRFREQRLDPCADRRLAHLHLSHILLPEPESALRDRHAVRKPGFLKRPVLIDESEPHGFSHSVNNPGSA